MNNPTTSIKEAIKRGNKKVNMPSKLILVEAFLLCLLLMVWSFSWWELLILPLGIAFSITRNRWAAERWRLWAYENVADIHQLQRSAELAGILPLHSEESKPWFLNRTKREQLELFRERLNDEPTFYDDNTVPEKSYIPCLECISDIGAGTILIDNNGLMVDADGLIGWGAITNERIATITYSRKGSNKVLRFEAGGNNYEIPLSLMGIKVWELDYLLYIHKGRRAAGAMR